LYIGFAAFNVLGPQVRFSLDAATALTTVQVRLAGSLADDKIIQLSGAVDLTSASFVL